MKYSIATLVVSAVLMLAGVSPSAHATGPKHSPPPKPAHDVPSVNNDVSNTALAGAVAASRSAASSQSGASASSRSDNVNTNDNANESSASISTRYEDRLQAPAVFAPPVYASGPCAYGWSAGLSIPGGGISGGKAKPDPSCDRRELARILTPLNPWLALKVACSDPIVVALLRDGTITEGACVYAPAAPPLTTHEAQPSTSGGAATADPVTRTEMSTAIDRAFKRAAQK